MSFQRKSNGVRLMVGRHRNPTAAPRRSRQGRPSARGNQIRRKRTLPLRRFYAAGWQSTVNTRFVNGDLPDETDGTDGLLPTDTADGELSRGSVTTYTGFDHA